MQMNVRAGRDSLANASAEKEKIRRHRFVFPKWKGSVLHHVKVKSSILFLFQARKVWVCVPSFKLIVSPPEMKIIICFPQ